MTDDPRDTGLTLSLLDKDSKLIDQVWAAGVDYADEWKYVQLTLDPATNYTDSYRFQFKVIKSNNTELGFVGFEDLVLLEGQICQPESLCTFDSDDCGWNNDGHGFRTYPSESLNIRDHTTRSTYGQFVYLPPSPELHSISDWNSPLLGQLNSIQCLSFWFLQTGVAGGVSVQLVGRQKQRFLFKLNEETLWSNNFTEITDEWMYVAVTVDFSRIYGVYFSGSNNGKHL